MNIAITNINDVPVPLSGYGYGFIDAADQHFKIKKADNSIIEYTNTLNDIQILDLSDYTAFEVYAHNIDLPIGSVDQNLGGDHTVKAQDIPSSMIHKMNIRTGSLSIEDSDIIIDWGDNSEYSVIASGDFDSTTIAPEDNERNYICAHEYSEPGKYIIKIFGHNYYNICTPVDSDNLEPKYNLITRIFDYDLPIASNVTNTSSICAYAIRLLSVHVPSYFDFSKVTNIGGMFRGCRNLESVKGMKNQFLVVNTAAQIFTDCYSLTTLEFTMPAAITRGRKCKNVSKLNFL